MILLTQPELVRAIRRRARLNQTELADRLGVKQTTVSQYETGRSAIGRAVLKLLQTLAETDEEKRSVEFWLNADQPPAEEGPADNIVALIRQAAGMSVIEFADALKISQLDLAASESGHDIPKPVIVRRLQAIATKHRRADLALILTSEEWKVSAVFHPGETFISAHPVARKRDHLTHSHELIDEIFGSGDPNAIDLAYRQLLISAELVRGLQKRQGKKQAG